MNDLGTESIAPSSSETPPTIPQKIDRITVADLLAEAKAPDPGETLIVLQRNAKDDRTPDSDDIGRLFPEAAQVAKDTSREFASKVFESAGADASKVRFLVVGSDTELLTPSGIQSAHKRGLETAKEDVEGIKEAAKDHGVPLESLFANPSGEAIELTSGRLKDLKMLEESPEFVNFLKEKCTVDGKFDEKKFWIEYEADTYRTEREAMGAEGPEDIAERVRNYAGTLSHAAELWHQNHPGQRLVVFAVSHYDNISPFIKEHVTHQGTTNDYLGIENNGGIAIRARAGSNPTSTIRGHTYNVTFMTEPIKEIPVIQKSDIKLDPPEGGTTIVLQRHAKYERDADAANAGSISAEAFAETKAETQALLDDLFARLGDQAGTVDFLVVASDTAYRGKGQRSMETAAAVLEGIEEKVQALSLPSHIVNKAHKLKGAGGPRPTRQLREPNIFTQAPDFVAFMEEKYPDEFWKQYEFDTEKEARVKMGGEGPMELGNRLAGQVSALRRYAEMYHQTHPGRRLVIWADTHYDTISPYVKLNLEKRDIRDYLPVDYGGGIAINIDASGNSSTEIQGRTYSLNSSA